MTNKIEVTEQPDLLRYEWEDMIIENNGGILIKIVNYTRDIYLTISQAKELAEILPEFIKKIEEEKQ